MFCLSRPYHFKFFKGSLPQISLGSFLNTLSHLLFKRGQTTGLFVLCIFSDMNGIHKLKWHSLTNHLMCGEMQINSIKTEVPII